MIRSLRAAALGALLHAPSACAHAGDGLAAPVETPPPAPPTAPTTTAVMDAGAAPIADASPPAATDAGAWRGTLITVRDAQPPRGRCPVAVEGAEVEVARVGRTRITVCDVALEWHRRTRAGLREDSPRPLVDGLLRDVLLATRAPMPAPTDAEIARTLVDALVHREAVAAMEPVDTSDAALARYADAHVDDFVREPRVHARALVLRTREAAQEAAEALRAGAAFAELLPRSIAPDAQRDHGDLGLLPRRGAQGVPGEVTDAAFALPADGAVSDPVAATARVAGRGRRPRASQVWYVVQRIERLDAAPLPEDLLRRRIAQRLLRDRYRAARREAEARLRASVAAQAREAVVPRALDAVRVIPPGH